MTKRHAFLGSLFSLGAACLFSPAVGFAQAPSFPKPLLTIKPDKGYLDDAMALTDRGSVFLYVNTDGLKFASLRAVALPPGRGLLPKPAATQAPPPQAPPVAPTPTPAAPKGAGAKGKTAAPPVPPPPPPLPPLVPFIEDALAQELAGKPQGKELLSNLPLNTSRLFLLSDDRVLVVMRDLETTGAHTATLYSLKTKAPIPAAQAFGPATDIAVLQPATQPGIAADGQPLILTVSKPGPQTPDNPRSLLSSEYKFSAFSSVTGKHLAQRTYKLDEEGLITTSAGHALPLYFLDDYATWAVKQTGAYDKKKDVRQPDYLAFLDVLTGKIRATRPIADPPGLLDVKRARAAQTASVAVVAEEGTHKVEYLAAFDRALPDGPVETRGLLSLPRPAAKYDATSLRFARLSANALLLSLMVDPVNEEAVRSKRADPDEVDFCLVNLPGAGTGDKLGPAERKLTLLAGKRPLAWVASPSGRIVALRKHKGFSRGGTEAEVYDLQP